MQHPGTHRFLLEFGVPPATPEPSGRRDGNDSSSKAETIRILELVVDDTGRHADPRLVQTVVQQSATDVLESEQRQPDDAEQPELRFPEPAERRSREQRRELGIVAAQFLPGLERQHTDLRPHLAQLRLASSVRSPASLRLPTATRERLEPDEAELEDRVDVRWPPPPPTATAQRDPAYQAESEHGHGEAKRHEARVGGGPLRGPSLPGRVESCLQPPASTQGHHSRAAHVAQVEDRHREEDHVQPSPSTGAGEPRFAAEETDAAQEVGQHEAHLPQEAGRVRSGASRRFPQGSPKGDEEEVASGAEVQAGFDHDPSRGARFPRPAARRRRLQGNERVELGSGTLRGRQSLRERVRDGPTRPRRIRVEPRPPVQRQVRRRESQHQHRERDRE